MKKHEEMKQKAMAYADVASYVDGCIEDAKADYERYKQLAEENENEKEYFQKEADLFLVKVKMLEVIYANLCKEVIK